MHNACDASVTILLIVANCTADLGTTSGLAACLRGSYVFYSRVTRPSGLSWKVAIDDRHPATLQLANLQTTDI